VDTGRGQGVVTVIGNAGRQLIKDLAAITGHRHGPRLRPVVRSAMDHPDLIGLVVLMLVGYAVRLLNEMRIDYADVISYKLQPPPPAVVAVHGCGPWSGRGRAVEF